MFFGVLLTATLTLTLLLLSVCSVLSIGMPATRVTTTAAASSLMYILQTDCWQFLRSFDAWFQDKKTSAREKMPPPSSSSAGGETATDRGRSSSSAPRRSQEPSEERDTKRRKVDVSDEMTFDFVCKNNKSQIKENTFYLG